MPPFAEMQHRPSFQKADHVAQPEDIGREDFTEPPGPSVEERGTGKPVARLVGSHHEAVEGVAVRLQPLCQRRLLIGLPEPPEWHQFEHHFPPGGVHAVDGFEPPPRGIRRDAERLADVWQLSHRDTHRPSGSEQVDRGVVRRRGRWAAHHEPRRLVVGQAVGGEGLGDHGRSWTDNDPWVGAVGRKQRDEDQR